MEKKLCFVISPIGKEKSDTRRRSDIVLKHIIKPSVEEAGYKVVRADNISQPGIITTQVIEHVVDAELVIADLTGTNPNVFYELAIRHMIKKPLIQIISEDETIPFDIAGTRTIHFNHTDLDSVEKTISEIKSQVIACEENNTIDTPISIAIDLKGLRQSDNLEDRSLAEIISNISDIKLELLGIQSKLIDPNSLFASKNMDKLIEKMNHSRSLPSSTLFDIYEQIEKLLSINPRKIKNATFREQLEELHGDLNILRGQIKKYMKSL